MSSRTVVVPFGRPATEALARVVAEAQAADPLAPVTVLVPSNVAGISARRLLGSGDLDAGVTGVANLTVSTPHQFAAHIGGAVAASSGVPLSNPVLGAAVRRSLAERPGALAPVAGHPATEQAVVRIYGELSHLGPAALERLRSDGRPVTRDLVDLVATIRGRLGSYYDEDDVARAACEVVASGSTPDIGTVVLYLVGSLTPGHTRLVDVVAGRFDVVFVVGRTGVDAADRALRPPSAANAGLASAATPAPVTEIISVADSDEEVRAAVRLIAERVDAGVPLHRMAVVYPTDEPYARTLHEQLDSAGIAWNGPATGQLRHTVAGRTLTRLLGLRADGLGREAVVDLVSGAPVHDRDGRIVPAARWDRLSRQAGVIAGVDDWRSKLAAYGDQLAADLATADADDSTGRQVHIGRDQRDLAALADFVERLVEQTEPPAGGSWADRAAWAEGGLDDLLGDAAHRARWPESELVAADAVTAALERVSVLDAVDPGPSDEVFARAVADELDGPMGRRGRVGVGVLLAPLMSAPGLDADIVIALGLAEGTCPSPRNEDSLLPDGDRALAGGDLAIRSERVHLDHANLLAALASGRHERVLIHPRGDHRSGRTRLPSRWLVDAAGRLVGAEVHASDIDDLEHPLITRVESYVGGLTAASAEASAHDLDLRTLAALTDPADLGPLADRRALRAGLDMVAARHSPAFTRFDGNLAGVDLPSPVEGRPLSATRIETWATCPFRYYLGYVLGLGQIERPERITQIGALDRGSLVHEVYERFGREVLDRPAATRPLGGQGWSTTDHDRLRAIAADVCDEYEARGVTGRPLLWRLARHDLLADFEQFLEADDALRAGLDTTWEAVEVPFGLEGETPVELTLADGRVARFRGVIDRIDRRGDGDAVVIDYKTGKIGRSSPYEELLDDPVARGTKVQLALYAEAVRQHHGATRPISRYWFATSAGQFTSLGYPYTAERRLRFRTVVEHAVRDIEAGVFPARPGEPDNFFGSHTNCGWCDFDDLCPPDRHERWVDLVEAPAIADYVALAEPIDEDPDNDDGGGADEAEPEVVVP